MRYLKTLMVLTILLFVVYSVVCVLSVILGRNESKSSLEAFYKRPPDIIAVFTGEAGRIPYALKMSLEYKQPNIFISGVYEKNTVDTILRPFRESGQIDENLLQIDYLARNTIENVMNTLHLLRKNLGMKRVLVISHDYHIMRIKMITNKLMSPDDDFEFYYLGIKTDLTNFKKITTLYREGYKLLKSYVFLLLWEPEIQTTREFD